MSYPALRYPRRALLILTVLVAASGCGLPGNETLLAGPPLAQEIGGRLGIPLKKTPGLDSTAVMANVEATYSGRSTNERILLVVFDSSAATVQLTRRQRRRDGNVDVVVRRNAVVLYEHERGTISRLAQIRAALDRSAHVG
jgi:hypothetical protein